MTDRQLTLMITWACDIRCAHCSQAHLKTHLDIAAAKRLITGLHEQNEIDRLGFTGGEPFLRFDTMVTLGSFAYERGLRFGVVTNGRWAKSCNIARDKIGRLLACGLDIVVISYDRFHQEFVPDSHIQILIEAVKSFGIEIRIYVSRQDATPLESIVDELSGKFDLPRHWIMIRDVVPVGYGEELGMSPVALPYFEIDKSCPMQNEYTVWPDGEMMPCCSSGTHKNLSLGNIYRNSIEDIIHFRRTNRVMKMLHSHNFDEIVIRLPEEIQQKIAARRYVSACHLCYDIMSDTDSYRYASMLSANEIGLIEKLLLTPAVNERMRAVAKRSWTGPPIVPVR